MDGDAIQNVEDMFLLHNFIVSSRSFQMDDGSPTTNHDSPVHVAFKHHYLLHSLLGLSALQLYTDDTSNTQRYSQATAHQDAATRMARPHLASLTSEHSEAVFWFSSFTTMFSLAEPIVRPLSWDSKRDWIEEWLNALALSRGIRIVLQQMPDSSDIKKATAPENWEDGRRDIESALIELRNHFPQLRKLEEFICIHCEQTDQRDVCLAMTEKLFSYLAVLQKDLKDKKNIYLVQVWSMELPDVFIQMCHDKHPVSITILAYYGVVMHSREFVWFFKGWPRVFLRECENVFRNSAIPLDDILEWPRAIIGKD